MKTFSNLGIICFVKVRQNLLALDKENFNLWLDSLDKNNLYERLLAAHTKKKYLNNKYSMRVLFTFVKMYALNTFENIVKKLTPEKQ